MKPSSTPSPTSSPRPGPPAVLARQQSSFPFSAAGHHNERPTDDMDHTPIQKQPALQHSDVETPSRQSPPTRRTRMPIPPQQLPSRPTAPGGPRRKRRRRRRRHDGKLCHCLPKLPLGEEFSGGNTSPPTSQAPPPTSPRRHAQRRTAIPTAHLAQGQRMEPVTGCPHTPHAPIRAPRGHMRQPSPEPETHGRRAA